VSFDVRLTIDLVLWILLNLQTNVKTMTMMKMVLCCSITEFARLADADGSDDDYDDEDDDDGDDFACGFDIVEEARIGAYCESFPFCFLFFFGFTSVDIEYVTQVYNSILLIHVCYATSTVASKYSFILFNMFGCNLPGLGRNLRTRTPSRAYKYKKCLK